MASDSSADFNVPVVDVHGENFHLIWPRLVYAVQSSSFIAIDCELSGLGNRKLINSQSVEDRYVHISNSAKTRSVISVGLSCFKLNDSGEMLQFSNQTFNLMALCEDEYVVEPGALKFLIQHGFDFHKQYSKGIPYYKGTDRITQAKGWTLRDLFTVLVQSRCPVVLHNGMVDLLFLYQNFYAELPASLPTFVADIDMLFASGIYDTKYIAEFELRASASFLEFLFRKEQVRNEKRLNAGKPAVTLTYNTNGIDGQWVDFWDCNLPPHPVDANTTVCKNYTNFGFCTKSAKCKESHDIMIAVLQEETRQGKKRKRDHVAEKQVDQENPPLEKGPQTLAHGKSDSAAIFASLDKTKNRICLSGKQFPLLIQKSSFAKQSKEHLAKYQRIMNVN